MVSKVDETAEMKYYLRAYIYTHLSTVSSLASLSIRPASVVEIILQITSSSNFILFCWLFLSFVIEYVLKSVRMQESFKEHDFIVISTKWADRRL